MTAALSLHAPMCLTVQEEESVLIMTYASASENGLVTPAQSILVDLLTIAQVKSIFFGIRYISRLDPVSWMPGGGTLYERAAPLI